MVKIGAIILLMSLLLTFKLPSVLLYYYTLQFIYAISPAFLEISVLLFCIFLGIMLFLVVYFLKRMKSAREEITLKQFINCFIVSLFVLLLFGGLFVPMIILQPVDSKIDEAIFRARSLIRNASVELVVKNITNFVNSEVKNSYNCPESTFEIDNFLSPLDYYVLSFLGFERAHIVVFQGWGSCGQYAVVTEYMLRNLGLSSRLARFIDQDHEWAEVYINGTWFIVDPWFIAHSFNNSILVQAKMLATTDEFKDSKGVIAVYPNGTQMDVSFGHGYCDSKP